MVLRPWLRSLRVKMKKNIVNIFLLMLLSMTFSICGCSSSTIIGQGETAAEGHRRHLRQLELARQGIAEDIDAVLLTDQPTRLSEMRIR